MKLSNFIEGLKTLQPYYDVDRHVLVTGHDQFFMYPTARPLTPEDVRKMRNLGWFQTQTSEDSIYKATAVWSAFV